MKRVAPPKTQVVATWAFAIGGPILLAFIVLGILQVDPQTARAWWSDHLYVQSWIELVFVGLLPLLWTILRKENFADYGLVRLNLRSSLLLSIGVTAIFHIYSRLVTGEWLSHASLSPVSPPLNFFYALLGIFANGPLEVFFVFFLIHKTDLHFNAQAQRISRGLVITIALVFLLHVLTTQSLSNAFVVASVFLLFGLIYKRTGNAIGPMLGWTLINGMTWAYLGLLT